MADTSSASLPPECVGAYCHPDLSLPSAQPCEGGGITSLHHSRMYRLTSCVFFDSNSTKDVRSSSRDAARVNRSRDVLPSITSGLHECSIRTLQGKLILIVDQTYNIHHQATYMACLHCRAIPYHCHSHLLWMIRIHSRPKNKRRASCTVHYAAQRVHSHIHLQQPLPQDMC